jgi:hypothetical protein
LNSGLKAIRYLEYSSVTQLDLNGYSHRRLINSIGVNTNDIYFVFDLTARTIVPAAAAAAATVAPSDTVVLGTSIPDQWHEDPGLYRKPS